MMHSPFLIFLLFLLTVFLLLFLHFSHMPTIPTLFSPLLMLIGSLCSEPTGLHQCDLGAIVFVLHPLYNYSRTIVLPLFCSRLWPCRCWAIHLLRVNSVPVMVTTNSIFLMVLPAPLSSCTATALSCLRLFSFTFDEAHVTSLFQTPSWALISLWPWSPPTSYPGAP